MSVPAHPDEKPLGRADAVARLFQEHNRSLVRYLAVRLQSVQEAKEIAQEAYVRLLQLDQPGVESFLKSYLYRVATNLAVDRLRQRGRWKTVEWTADQDLGDGISDPEQGALASEELQAVTSGLSELPANCREAFLRYRLDGMGQQQIAQELGVTERMVRHYITQAIVYCRLRMEGWSADQAKERLRK
jgi:RNA polymerase sigma factor (sigma-70 family)